MFFLAFINHIIYVKEINMATRAQVPNFKCYAEYTRQTKFKYMIIIFQFEK